MAGWTAYVCLLLGIIGIPFSLLAITLTIARVRAARLVAILVLCLGGLAPAFGAFGMYRGRAIVDDVLLSPAIEPSNKAKIRQQGYYEAQQALNVGLVCGALPLLLGAVSLALTFAIPPRKREG